MLRKRCTVDISFIVRTSLSEACGSTGNAIFIATVLGIRLCISIFRRLSVVLENGGYCTDRRCRRERGHSFTGAFKLLFTIFFTQFYKTDTGLVPLLGSLARFQKMLNNAFGTFTHICRPTPEFFCIVPQIFTMVFGHMIGIDNRLNTVFFKPFM